VGTFDWEKTSWLKKKKVILEIIKRKLIFMVTLFCCLRSMTKILIIQQNLKGKIKINYHL